MNAHPHPYPYPTLRPMFDELRGQRVLVRPYRETDAEELFQAIIASRDSLLPWMPFAGAYESVEDAREFVNRCIAHWRLREDFTVGMWDVASGRYVGSTGLHPRNWDIPMFEISYWLRRDAEGHGYVTEAVRLLTHYAFASLGAARVFIRCDARNGRSAATAARAGFPLEGRLRRDRIAYDGVLGDTLIYALTPEHPR
ncbi:MAG: GNAT family N-acetyltransferase [Ktedonobacterales bacterium]